MPDRELAQRRLVAQGLVTRPYATPHDAVRAFAAMQGQDLPGVLASAALRSTGRVEDVLAALNDGLLVRGYPMRGTIFLTAAEDLRWMTELMAGAPLRGAGPRRRELGLDEEQFDRAGALLLEALARAPRGLSRNEALAVLDAAGLSTGGGRGYHILYTLISRSVLCYGPWNGGDQNIVAVSSWLSEDSTLERRFNGDEVAATAELMRRYFTSHGPATVRDFSWWSKIPLTQCRAALPLVDGVEQVPGDEPAYVRLGLADEVTELGRAVAKPLLLPGFDEFILGYQDRLFAMTPEQHVQLVPGNNGVFRKSIVAGGLVRGFWLAKGRLGTRTLDAAPFRPLAKTTEAAVRRRFAEYPHLPA
ncbi:winged helix DNA-binding domain-containing protein [Tessaracoccus caeni]|uniref:winged helix DNA-binding domain-containing protein n=1 Tax=Tessaracoccus caeni TaxID=3031239 RepID=UPI0023DB2946|nr:winged helix DNA-binding domain-containing protein [Tessaracoccus caeni]MDF1487168.1 winged helix DNA-binding domain-containing protein [Tessaracoccus caeni]